MVVHLFDWSKVRAPFNRVIQYSEEEWTIIVLAGLDPRLLNHGPIMCPCPKIGKRYCSVCFGEGIYWYGKDSKELGGNVR